MKTVIIVQARMGSTRLPGKVMKTVLGKTLLEYLFERLWRVRRADLFMVATTTNPHDAVIVEHCRHLGVPVICGSEDDVLARYYRAATIQQADIIVRITADCPLIDPAVIDKAIKFFHENIGRYEYVSNTLKQSYPYGMAVEVFSFGLLEQAYREARKETEREHVTPFFYTRPERFRIGQFVNEVDLSHHRWTVDTQEDFELIRLIIEELYIANLTFGLDDILKCLEEHPAWTEINAHVKQKKLDE
jgi:spore coat polysaccharide biosynthesis protein SpsF